PEASIGLEVDESGEDRVLMNRLAVRRQTHQLILAAVHLEPAVVREGRVKQAKRMRKLEMMRQPNPVPGADAERRRAPLAHAVERQNRGLVERAGKERARGVTLMMIGEDNRSLRRAAESVSDDLRQTSLLLQPERHRHPEAPEPVRGVRQVRFEQSLEF